MQYFQNSGQANPPGYTHNDRVYTFGRILHKEQSDLSHSPMWSLKAQNLNLKYKHIYIYISQCINILVSLVDLLGSFIFHFQED